MSLGSLGALSIARLLHANLQPKDSTEPLQPTPGHHGSRQGTQGPATAAAASILSGAHGCLTKEQGSHPEMCSSHGAGEASHTAEPAQSSTCLEPLTTGRTVPGHLLCGWQTPSSQGVGWACSRRLTAEMNSTQRNMLVASFCCACWCLTHPGLAHLHHGTLRRSCCLQHGIKPTHHSTGCAVQDYSQVVHILKICLQGKM